MRVVIGYLFFLHWPNGGHTSGNEIDDLTANIDLLPTLIDLCNVDLPETADFHGISLASRLTFEINQLTERVIVTDSQKELNVRLSETKSASL